MPIQWREKLSVGFTDIDDDHKHLLCLLNGVEVLLKRHVSKPAMLAFLDELAEYTAIHFAREEELMFKANYPKFMDHKVQHQKLIEELESIRREIDDISDSEALHKRVIDLLDILKKWLIDHIIKEDKHYEQFIKEFKASH